MVKLVTVMKFSSRLDAEMRKGLLKSNGIESIVSADDAGGMRPQPMAYKFGAKLKVNEKDLQKAKEILEITNK